jgi:lysophospholipid acyltransferase (LPLAT)-like uncharacterized protein
VRRARHPWWMPLAAWAGAGLVRLLGATWRFELADAPEYTAAEAGGERFIYAFWHSALLPMAVMHRGRGIAVLVSRHRDGELITRIIHRLGYVTGRGSSTRGGEAGVREMLAWADAGRHLAFTPDGPRGPAERAKEGASFLAQRTGRRVVPIALGVRSAWVLRSWDRFRIPKPFARVVVAHGAPLPLPAGDGRREEARVCFDGALQSLTRETRARAGEVLP